jgi:hypothetical protein
MPVVLRVRGYRFWFYEADLREPPHVHVGKGEQEAKFWLDPVAMERAGRFRRHELGEIERIVVEHRDALMAEWQEEARKRGDRQS